MTQLSYKCFHACENKGTYEDIVRNIPFKSGNGADQWLTEGYYFWTDSDHWAYKWRNHKPLEERVIGEFGVDLCHETELLDLVGNVEHQLQFNELKNTLLTILPIREQKNITVHQIISYFRCRENVFPYYAIKAQDGKNLYKLPFVDPQFGHGEKMQMVTRQQMCVFSKAKERITLNSFTHPIEFNENLS